MRIKSFKIQNYRSLQDIELKNLNNLIILVGKNSSGKTNLFEALWLFFKDFSLLPKVEIDSPLEGNELLWFGGYTENPIKFNVNIDLSESESKEMFSSDFLKTQSENSRSSIEVERQIVADSSKMYWETTSLKCGTIRFIKDGKIVSAEENDSKKLKDYSVQIEELNHELADLMRSSDFPSEKKSLTTSQLKELDNTISVLNGKFLLAAAKNDRRESNILSKQLKEAHMRRNELLNLKRGMSKNRDDYAKEISELESKIKSLRSEYEKAAETSIGAVAQLLKNCISYIASSSQAKSATPNNVGNRTSIVPDSTNSDLVKTGENLTPKIRKVWKKAQSEFRSFSSHEQELSIVQSKLMLDESDICVPL